MKPDPVNLSIKVSIENFLHGGLGNSCTLKTEFPSKKSKPLSFVEFTVRRKSLLRGIMIAMYIVGQERRLVDPPSQVVAGVRTVTTN